MVITCTSSFSSFGLVFCIYGLCMILSVISDYLLEQRYPQLIFVMAKCGVLFEVRTEFLHIVQTSLGFKQLNGINSLIFVT
jgi:hypothetical protein